MSEAVSAPRRDTAKHTEATPASSGGGLSHRQILTILSGLMLGMFLAALDQTIVSTSIRTIADDLHGLSQQAWATTAYLITSTIATPLYGKLSDLHGRKPYFLGAITVFIVGSAACTFSTSMTELAAFRALQGIGAGGLMSLALAIIGDIVPPRERARYQGYMLATFATSSVAGPLIGGFLAGQDSILGVVGWRWVFLVNVPIGIIALFVVAKVLNIPHTRRDRRIDWWGAFTIALGVVPLLLVAEQGREWGWDSTRSLACYGIGVVGIISWILVERRMGDDALIPMRLFRNAIFSKTSLLSVLIGAGMFGGMLMIPQYLQIVKGASPTKSGLEMLPLMARHDHRVHRLRPDHREDRPLQDLPDHRHRPHGHGAAALPLQGPVGHPAVADHDLHARLRPRPRRLHADPGPRRAERRAAAGHGRGDRVVHVLPADGRHRRYGHLPVGAVLERRRQDLLGVQVGRGDACSSRPRCTTRRFCPTRPTSRSSTCCSTPARAAARTY